MRNKAILSILGISLVVLFIVMGIFLGRSDSKMQDLFDKTITALDNEEGLKELFNDYAVKESKTLDEDIKKLIIKLDPSAQMLRPKDASQTEYEPEEAPKS